MKRFLKWILISVLLVIGLGVAWYVFGPGKAVTLVFPDLNQIYYINAVIKNDSADTKIDVVLQNKNPYKLVIDTITFDLLLNDTSIAQQKIALNLDQKSFDEDTVGLPVKLSIKKIKSLIAHLQGQDSTDFEAKGYVVYQTIFGRMKLNFDKHSRIGVPVPPQFKILKVERERFSLREKKLYVIISLEIINKGKNLDLELSGVDYDLNIGGELQSAGTIDKVVSIKPQSSVRIDIPMVINVRHPLKTAWMIGTDNDRLPYTLYLKGIVKENVSKNAFTSMADVKAEGTIELRKEKSPH